MSRQPWSTNSARTVSNSEITQAEDAVTIYRPESAQHSHLRTQTMRMTPEEDGESVVRRASAGRSFNGSLKDPSFHADPVSTSMDSLDAQIMGRNEDQLSLARVGCLNENAAQHTANFNENLPSSPSNMPTVVCRPIASICLHPLSCTSKFTIPSNGIWSTNAKRSSWYSRKCTTSSQSHCYAVSMLITFC
ncbi:hypothetical protein EB796_000917 [Bugula neritina]|uniref:Uncharacterized protein n=1 Tax=Bugula neritina TaxID=10212 RepID=A0A7J7KRP2_BUGNE|nr:hypothetical protein EB796_000917 [Bugula neritina]